AHTALGKQQAKYGMVNQERGEAEKHLLQNSAGGKEATMGVFRKQEDDPEKLAVSSLEASKTVHDAALREYLASSEPHTLNEPVLQNIRRTAQAKLNEEQAKEKAMQEAQQ